MVGTPAGSGEPLHFPGRSQSTLTGRDAAISPGVGINAGHGFCRRSETAAYQPDSLYWIKVSPTIRGWWDIILCRSFLSRFPFGY